MAVLTGTGVSVGSLVEVAAGRSVGASVGDIWGVFVAPIAAVGVASTFPATHPDKIREKIKINLRVDMFFIVKDSLFYSFLNKVNGTHIPPYFSTVHDLLVIYIKR
jgi:hypothetical protein